MAKVDFQHPTVLDAAARQSRLARVYAEALLTAAAQEAPERIEEVGAELQAFVEALAANPDAAAFLANPAIGKKAKAAALAEALQHGASPLLRGLLHVLLNNNRFYLLTSIATAYQQILDQRAGRIPVKVTTAVPLSDTERERLITTLRQRLHHEPVLSVRVNPELLGGMIVQVGDTVIDSSVRSRLQSLRSLLLEQ
ncbi:MAG: F0F1 ATP synthase subunit delta [Gemmataceae bacterium]|nr:F0F1 ATP synthase subunit delta [Gemmata sp.]MDW8198980.1 F0F1 ATP synthase subunit delta [Gemmataceae bacterium]